MKIGKINIGQQANNKAKFNWSHDVTTTADFGFMQPLMNKFVVANSTINFKLNSAVRMAPMPAPTYGNVQLKSYHYFVPIEDIMPTWNHFLSGKKYNGVNTEYVPTSVPNIQNSTLWKALCAHSYVTTFSYTGAGTGTNSENIGQLTLITDGTYNTACEEIHMIPNGTFNSATTWYTNMVKPNYVLEEGATGYSTPLSADYVATYEGDSANVVFCFKLSVAGKRLRKIFLGCGYQINYADDVYVSILPLFAYYKAYFDNFYPKRDMNWEDTTCAKLIRQIAEQNYNLSTQANQTTGLLGQFLAELRNCFYTDVNDYVSAHIPTPAIADSTTSITTQSYTGTNQNIYTSTSTNQPYTNLIGGSTTYYVDQARLDILKKLTTLVNANTVIGGDLRAYLRAEYGAQFDEDQTAFIGHDITDCQVSDVYATNDSSEVDLGQFAGKGIGSNEKTSGSYTYTFKKAGYFLTIAGIVPSGGWFQGIDPENLALTRFEYPDPRFDAVGFESTPVAAVFADQPIFCEQIAGQPSIAGGFGYIPRYSGFKICQNICNGDITARSTRDSFSYYTLDKWITTDTNNYTGDGTTTEDTLQWIDHDLIWINTQDVVASTLWRYIGRYNALNNFNRIFYNQGVTTTETQFEDADTDTIMDDNFIVHNHYNMTYYAPLKPMEDSFDTDEYKNPINVEKA